jgi:hypothetical protein
MEGTMSKVVTLPSGATVKLRDPQTLLMKDRNRILEIANKQEGMLQALAMQNGLIAVSVIEWSFDLIPPNVRISSLEELTPKDYDVLAKHAEEAANYLFPTLVDTGNDDPKASTANSAD